MLDIPQKTYYVLDYRRFDDLVKKHFQKPNFDSVLTYEWNDGCDYTFSVRIKDVDEQDIKDFEEKDEYVHWSDLIGELAKRKVLPEGDYLIEVSW